MDYLNRKLGFAEKFFTFAHDCGGLIHVNVARIEGPITPDILRQALDLAQKHHPMLQVHIVELDDLYFQSEGTQKIPLRVIDKQYENQWIDIAEDESHQKFPGGTACLCRVTFLRADTSNGISEIIATFHHGISDGLSCVYFIDELLSYCQQIAAGEYIPEVVMMQPLPPIENLIDSSLTRDNNVEEAKEKSPQEMPTPKLIIEGEAPPSDRRTRFVPRIFSKDMTIMLKSRCKQEETTVHSALCAAMIFGVAKIADTDKSIHLSCMSSVNLRKYCNPKVKDEYLSPFASALQEIHTWELTTNFWDLARECKSKISSSISRLIHITSLHKEQANNFSAKDWQAQIPEHQMGRVSTVHISNVGQLNFSDKYGSFLLKEIYFGGGLHLAGSCFFLTVVTCHEQLFCNFIYAVPVISVKTGELFANSVLDTIQKECIS